MAKKAKKRKQSAKAKVASHRASERAWNSKKRNAFSVDGQAFTYPDRVR